MSQLRQPGRVLVLFAIGLPGLLGVAVGASAVNVGAVAQAGVQQGESVPYAIFAAGICPSAYADPGLDISGNNNTFDGAVHGNGNIKNAGNNNDSQSVTYNAACTNQ